MVDFTDIGEDKLADLRTNMDFLGKLRSASTLAESSGAQGIRMGGIRGQEAEAIQEVAGQVGLPQDLQMVLAQNAALKAAGGRGYTGGYRGMGAPRDTFEDIQESIEAGVRPGGVRPDAQEGGTGADSGSDVGRGPGTGGQSATRSMATQGLKNLGSEAALAGVSGALGTGTLGGLMAGASVLSPANLMMTQLPSAMSTAMTSNQIDEAMGQMGLDPTSDEAREIGSMSSELQASGYGRETTQSRLGGVFSGFTDAIGITDTAGKQAARQEQVAAAEDYGFKSGPERKAMDLAAAANRAKPITTALTSMLPQALRKKIGVPKTVAEMLGGDDGSLGASMDPVGGLDVEQEVTDVVGPEDYSDLFGGVSKGSTFGELESSISGGIQTRREALAARARALGITPSGDPNRELGSTTMGRGWEEMTQREVDREAARQAREQEAIEAGRLSQSRGWTTEGGRGGIDATAGLGGVSGDRDADLGSGMGAGMQA